MYDISVIVCSYNSEKTILETLESIDRQSYKNFEVIIVDDCSKDNTLKVVEKWQEKTKISFQNILVEKSSINEGIVKNLNKGIVKARGEWIKIIAADDILVESCLKDNIEWIKKNKDILVLTSIAQYFSNKGKLNKISPMKQDIKKFTYGPKEQYKELLKKFYVCSVSSFIKKEVFEKIGLFDERIPLIEDYPFFLKITQLGIPIFYMPKVTVKYRVGESVSNTQKNIINLNFFSSKQLVFKYYLEKNVPYALKLHYKYEFFIYKLAIYIFKNKKNKLSTTFLNFLKLFDIFLVKNKIKNYFVLGE